jgi:hypothetical protein
MNSRSVSAVLPASQAEVFDYLSGIENLPGWAVEFCRELRKVDGRQKIVTPAGELFFRIDSDARGGVIDMWAGPSEDAMALFPARVAALPGGGSVFTFTMIQMPDVPDAEFEDQHQSFLRELAGIRRRFGAA